METIESFTVHRWCDGDNRKLPRLANNINSIRRIVTKYRIKVNKTYDKGNNGCGWWKTNDTVNWYTGKGGVLRLSWAGNKIGQFHRWNKQEGKIWMDIIW